MASATARAVDQLLATIVGASRLGGHNAGREQFRVGLVGRGIQASRSPRMHELEAARLGLGYSYTLFDFDRLDLSDSALGEVVGSLAEAGFTGINVTHPFKQSIIAHATDLAPEAAGVGAVNTLVFGNGRRIGHNTDSWGFAQNFREHMAGTALDRVLQIGAGGGGAAVAHALCELGVEELVLVDVDRARAQALATRLATRFGRAVTVGDAVSSVIGSMSGVVNATPVGMDKYPGVPLPPELLQPRHWVADIVYFPQETALLRAARELGCRTLSGTGMAVYQAIKAFELFTGVVADPAAMTRHFGATP